MKHRIRSQWHVWFLRTAAIIALGAFAIPYSTGAATDATARVVKYAKEDIIPVRAKLRFSTLIVLPAEEEILDFTTGDKEFWVINGAHNLCYVHPAQTDIRSNLNLITASGHVYSFLLTEVSNQPNTEPDLKIFVEKAPASRSTPACVATSAPVKPRPTRRNSTACARMRPIRSASRRRRPPNK
jgi:type IV secretory pathway VirB9-like protein